MFEIKTVKFKSKNPKQRKSTRHSSPVRNYVAGRDYSWAEVYVQNQLEKIISPTVEGYKFLHDITKQGSKLEVKMAKRNRVSKSDCRNRGNSSTIQCRTGGGVIHIFKRQRTIG